MNTFRCIKTLLNVANTNTTKKIYWIYILSVLATVAEVFSIGTIIPIFSNTEKILAVIGLDYLSNPLIVATLLFTIIFILKSIFVLWVISMQNKYAYGIQKQISMKIFSGLVSLDYEQNLHKGRDYFTSLINVDVIVFRDTLLLVILLMTETLIVVTLISIAILMFPTITILICSIFVLGMFCFRMSFAPLSRRFGKRRLMADLSKNAWLSSALDTLDVIHAQRLSKFFEQSYLETVSEVSKVGANQGVLNQAPRFIFESLAILCIAAVTLTHEIAGNIFVIGDDSGSYYYLVLGAIAFRLLPSVNRIVGSLQGISFGQAPVMELDKLFQDLKETDVNYNVNKADKSFNNKIVEVKTENLTKTFGQNKVLDGGCAKFFRGKIYAILGKSGSGKSTFIKVMIGLFSKNRRQR